MFTGSMVTKSAVLFAPILICPRYTVRKTSVVRRRLRRFSPIRVLFVSRPFISPLRVDRASARRAVEPNRFTGVSVSYAPPVSAEIVLHTEQRRRVNARRADWII